MRLTILGGGNMGGSILHSIEKIKDISPKDILLIEKDEQKRTREPFGGFDRKGHAEEDGADAKEREGFGVEGMDETGREYAFQVFKNRGVRQSIIDGYKNLKNDKDRKLFKDWMMINLNLYLKKFEEENFGQPDYEIPENPEAAAEEPPMGGEEMPPEPDMGGEMMPPEEEEVIPPPSFE